MVWDFLIFFGRLLVVFIRFWVIRLRMIVFNDVFGMIFFNRGFSRWFRMIVWVVGFLVKVFYIVVNWFVLFGLLLVSRCSILKDGVLILLSMIFKFVLLSLLISKVIWVLVKLVRLLFVNLWRIFLIWLLFVLLLLFNILRIVLSGVRDIVRKFLVKLGSFLMKWVWMKLSMNLIGFMI